MQINITVRVGPPSQLNLHCRRVPADKSAHQRQVEQSHT
eukprot:COSAG01_NODE_29123_length_644_cov_20.451376_3_plen_38_part_01